MLCSWPWSMRCLQAALLETGQSTKLSSYIIALKLSFNAKSLRWLLPGRLRSQIRMKRRVTKYVMRYSRCLKPSLAQNQDSKSRLGDEALSITPTTDFAVFEPSIQNIRDNLKSLNFHMSHIGLDLH